MFENIEEKYLEILFPGFTQLPENKKKELTSLPIMEEFMEELSTYIDIHKADAKKTHLIFFSSIDEIQVENDLKNSRYYYEQTYPNEIEQIKKTIGLNSYPFLTFLSTQAQTPPDIDNTTDLMTQLNTSYEDYFRYRFAPIAFIRLNDECNMIWTRAWTNFDSSIVTSIHEIHEDLIRREKDVLFEWLKQKLRPTLTHFVDSNDIDRYLIKYTNILLDKSNRPESMGGLLLEALKRDLAETLKSNTIPAQDIYSPSISELFKDLFNAISQNIPQEMAEISDVHAIIQASGFSTQNEYSHLAIFDFINYIKYKEHIKNLKSISGAFLRPLLPLYWEWVYVSKQPISLINTLRLIFPILLLSAYIIGLESLLIFNISEIAMFLITIISIYIGLIFISCMYDTFKTLHQDTVNYYYGGRYETPTYQVNPRMKNIFQEPEARQIRELYIHSMKDMDNIIKKMEYQMNTVGINEDELKVLNSAVENRKKLEIEWMGIHHLSAFPINKAKEQARTRIIINLNQQYKKYKEEHTSDCEQAIHHIESTLINNQTNHSLFSPKYLSTLVGLNTLSALRI